jgi:hypothetical protein
MSWSVLRTYEAHACQAQKQATFHIVPISGFHFSSKNSTFDQYILPQTGVDAFLIEVFGNRGASKRH